MLGSSKWAPGGANDEGEANPPTPPANAPTGPRDAQRGRRKGPKRGGKEANDERSGRDGNVGGVKLPPEVWSGSMTMGHRPLVREMYHSAPNQDTSNVSQPLTSISDVPQLGRYPHLPQKLARDSAFSQNRPTTTTSILPQNENSQSGAQQAEDKTSTPPVESQTVRKDADTPVAGAIANPDIEARIRELEDQQNHSYNDIDALEQMYNRLSASVNHLKYFKYNPGTTPARPTVFHAANNETFHVPKQGNLTDTDFLFLLKKLAGRQISVEEWDNAVKQIRSWDLGSAAGASQCQATTANVKVNDSTDTDLEEGNEVHEKQVAPDRPLEWEEKAGEELDEAEQNKDAFLGSLNESDGAEKL